MTAKPKPRHKTTARHAASKGRIKKRPPQPKGEPRHWIMVTDHKRPHLYRKTPGGIERIPDEHLHAALPEPAEEASHDDFLREVSSWLDAAREDDRFDRIALIGPPEVLDALHGLVGDEVHSCICGALARDVANITEEEVEDHISEVVWL